jgi:hypothetical protein
MRRAAPCCRAAGVLAAVVLLAACQREAREVGPGLAGPTGTTKGARSRAPSAAPKPVSTSSPAPKPVSTSSPAPKPVSTSSPGDRRRCVPSRRSGCDWTYNQELPRVPSERLVKTIRPRAGAWRSEDRRPVTRGAIAGACPYTSARATVIQGAREVKLQILDAIRACACEPGKPWRLATGAAWRRVKVGGLDAVTRSAGGAHALTLVAPDCCRVTLEGQAPVTAEELLTAAAVVDVAALGRICAAGGRRAGGGGP